MEKKYKKGNDYVSLLETIILRGKSCTNTLIECLK